MSHDGSSFSQKQDAPASSITAVTSGSSARRTALTTATMIFGGADALRVAEFSQGRDAGPQHLPRQLHFVFACSKYLQASASTGKLGPNFGDDIMFFHFRQLPFL